MAYFDLQQLVKGKPIANSLCVYSTALLRKNDSLSKISDKSDHTFIYAVLSHNLS